MVKRNLTLADPDKDTYRGPTPETGKGKVMIADCTFDGDSLAVGAHQYFQECRMKAKVGISSVTWNKNHPNGDKAKTVVISLGSNDGDYTSIRQVREKIEADEVIWIVPYRYGEYVLDIARSHGDKYIFFKCGRDGIHPPNYNYKNISKSLKQVSPYLRNLK